MARRSPKKPGHPPENPTENPFVPRKASLKKLQQAAKAPYVMATVHPSSILRAPDETTRHAEMRRFVEDMRKIPSLL